MKLSYKRLTLDVPVSLLRCLKRRMRWVRAAGGICTDADGQMLLIERNGRWDLPKGKVEAGETLVQAAVRETLEETGISATPTAQAQPVVKTYHIYNLYGGWHLKQTSWYAMSVDGHHPAGHPQAEEGIERVVWVDAESWVSRLGTSYGTLKTIAHRWTHWHR